MPLAVGLLVVVVVVVVVVADADVDADHGDDGDDIDEDDVSMRMDFEFVIPLQSPRAITVGVKGTGAESKATPAVCANTAFPAAVRPRRCMVSPAMSTPPIDMQCHTRSVGAEAIIPAACRCASWRAACGRIRSQMGVGCTRVAMGRVDTDAYRDAYF
jgi:hypothetical protein